MIEGFDFVLVGLAAMAAGAVNALAGGGTLITFPTLTFLGLSPVTANVTNTVALCPGYLGGIFAQANDIRGQRRRLWLYMPVGAIGGVIGGVLLLYTQERVFRVLVPFLILMASALLALQGKLRAWLLRRAGHASSRTVSETWVMLPVGPAAVYGGYFGAGLSVIVLAGLGLILDDSLTRLNALKQAISFSVNVAAAIFFVFSGHVVWPVALVMAAGALVGGALGGRLAGKVRPELLRWVIVTIGVAVALIYMARL